MPPNHSAGIFPLIAAIVFPIDAGLMCHECGGDEDTPNPVIQQIHYYTECGGLP
jgi:hypothetical protein